MMTEHTSPTPDAAEAATLVYRRETFTVRPGITVRDAIIQCGLSPEATLATRGGQLITDEVTLDPGDRVKLIATISGG